MPMSYRIDEVHGILEVTIEGELSGEELAAWTEEVRADPAFRPTFDQLLDLRGAQGTRLETAAVRELAQNKPLFARTSRRAIVVASDFGFGMARMFQAMRGEEAGEIQVFRDIEEAQAWLASG
jgi:hypothetical protein